jgi:molybdopterin synthase sulfur carrier subunit
MKLHLKFFASLREALGPGESLDVREGSTVESLRDELIARGEPHASALARKRAVRAALNHAMVDEPTPLNEGSEVAFFPPVTGG